MPFRSWMLTNCSKRREKKAILSLCGERVIDLFFFTVCFWWTRMGPERSLTLAKAQGSLRRPDTLAVILGWYGCTPRNLRRHAEVFTDALHTDTVVYAPCMSVASFPLVGRCAARALAKEISKHDEDSLQGSSKTKTKLVFLVLSGHGENLLHHFILEQVCSFFCSNAWRILMVMYCFVCVVLSGKCN